MLFTPFLGGGGVEGKRNEDPGKVDIIEIFRARDSPAQSSPAAPSPMASRPHSSQEPSRELRSWARGVFLQRQSQDMPEAELTGLAPD